MVLESPRLLLRPLRASDFDDFFEYRKDPELCRYQGFEAFSEQEAREFLKKYNHIDLEVVGQWFQIGIEEKASGILVGDCALKFLEEEPRIAEIGFTISPTYQGKGYATEAMSSLFEFLFREKGIHKFFGLVDVRNIPSIRLMEKLGFVREAHFRKSYFDTIDDAWMDEYQYGLLKEDLKNRE